MTALRDLWDDFCRAHAIAASGVPLFSANKAGVVETFGYGRNSRPMLRRSPAMRAKIIATVNAVLSSPPSKYEGILYMMHRVDPEERIVPLYVGKAARYGRFGAAVSANLENIERDEGKFARWDITTTIILVI